MKPTDKQISAAINMKRALGWGCEIPDTKEEVSKLIGQIKKEIETRLAITGQISKSRHWNGDDNYCDATECDIY
jgi:hypothetical protein